MQRQPFLPQYKGKSFGIGANVINQRPGFVLSIGKCLTLWPFVEHQMAMILGLLMNAESEASIAVFNALRTGRAQQDALSAAASLALPPDRLRLFEAILSVVNSTAEERADLAHGHWGVLDDYEDRVLWIESRHHSPWNTLVIAKEMKGEQLGHEKLLERLCVVRLTDIEAVHERIDECWKTTFDLFGLLRNSTANGIYKLKGGALFRHLCELPRIADAISRQHLRSLRSMTQVSQQ